jgi:hypothetical protein
MIPKFGMIPNGTIPKMGNRFSDKIVRHQALCAIESPGGQARN